ncbi:Flavoredoxin [Clostridium sp. N3C]|uniref:flavin reductase family protein n=1 Tax=Clostridium sp. N3C TaxID=1776758 RepID=UPI00092E028E|nr:flavin reductase family protein [Clostridium sp. N3C]SCN21562.1 Flavoredoxin [Clostridium sp. N3C]
MSVDFTKNLDNIIEYFHKRGAFLTTKNKDELNTMTISWGNVGFVWGKPIFTVFVRKSRHTHHIIEESGEFTVSIPMKDTLKNALAICGSKSGRDVNKFEEANISTIEGKEVNTPVIADCGMYFECKVIYKQDMSPEFLRKDIVNTSYIDDDYHTIYYGEIVSCYQGK